MTERFELLKRLGSGAMATAWMARDTTTGSIIAVKVLHPHLVDDFDILARFEREVELSARVNSPFVVRALGFGERDGNPYLAMEYVPGKSLATLLREEGAMPWLRARVILNDAARGIAALHAAGIIHRDIKPGNILIDNHGRAKLADLGVAVAADVTRLTAASTLLGTPAYMAPDSSYVAASDYYSLGCTAFEVLTGAPPFVVTTVQEAAVKHVREMPNFDALPIDAREVIRGLLEKDPAKRQQFVSGRLATPPPITPDRQRPTSSVAQELPRSARGEEDVTPIGALVVGLGVVITVVVTVAAVWFIGANQ